MCVIAYTVVHRSLFVRIDSLCPSQQLRRSQKPYFVMIDSIIVDSMSCFSSVSNGTFNLGLASFDLNYPVDVMPLTHPHINDYYD